MKDNSIFSTATGTIGMALSFANIYTILSVVVLILSAINIIYGLSYTIYKRIKNKEYDKIDDDMNDAIEKLNDLEK